MKPSRTALVLLISLLMAGPLMAQDASHVTRLSTISDGWNKVYYVDVSGDYAYVAHATTGLSVVDVSDRSNPSEVGDYNTPNVANCVKVSGNYAYVADGGSGLQIINISTPSSPSYTGSYDTPGIAARVALCGNYAYVADYTGGLQIINVSTPASPTLAGSYATPGNCYDVDVRNDTAYVALDAYGMYIYDCTAPGSISLIGSYDTPGQARGLDLESNYVYVADGTAGGLQIIDVSNPASPTRVGSYNTGGGARGVKAVGPYVYVADMGEGLRVFDIMDLNNITEAGYYNTAGTSWSVTVASGSYAFVADDTNLGIFDCSEATGYDLSDQRLIVTTEYATIQAAIDSATTDGDTVLVLNGTYYENIHTNRNDIIIGSLYLTTGDTSHISRTTIDGGGNSCVVAFNREVGNASSLVGFTLTNGHNHRGGGIVVWHSSPTIRRCVITGNTASQRGGGILCYLSSPAIDSCTIISNSAVYYGGGIHCEGAGSPVITRCGILENNATYGGGISSISATPTVSYCEIDENYATSTGGGIWAQYSNFSIDHTLITENPLSPLYTTYGAGMYCYASDPDLDFCTFARNMGRYGVSLFLAGGSDADINSCILRNNFDQEIWCQPRGTANSVTISYTSIYGGLISINIFTGPPYNSSNTLTNGGGCDSINPGFVDYYAGDFHLQDISPCVDTGDLNAPNDPDDTRADMGALYYDQSGDGMLLSVIQPACHLPTDFSLGAAYPNPFNAETHIPYLLPADNRISIAVFDIGGRRVVTLVDGVEPAGYHVATWDGRSLPTGLYVVRMNAGDFSKSRRVMLVK